MRLEQKRVLTEKLTERIGQAGTIYLTDFTGLDVAAMTELRERLRQQGVEVVVAKNTLARRAFEGLGMPELTEHLRGPTALVLAPEDPIPAAKVVWEFARQHDNRPVVKVGVVERRTVPAEAVLRLAELPPRDQLLGSIAGSLTAGVAGIVGVLEGLLRDVAWMIEEVARKSASERGATQGSATLSSGGRQEDE